MGGSVGVEKTKKLATANFCPEKVPAYRNRYTGTLLAIANQYPRVPEKTPEIMEIFPWK